MHFLKLVYLSPCDKKQLYHLIYMIIFYIFRDITGQPPSTVSSNSGENVHNRDDNRLVNNRLVNFYLLSITDYSTSNNWLFQNYTF